MSFWTPVEDLGTRPPRSRVFDIACTLLAAPASFGSFSFAQAAHPAPHLLALSLVVGVLTAAVPAQWPVRSELFQVALARSAADGIANPDLQARVQALPGGEPDERSRGKRLGGNDYETPRIRCDSTVTGTGGRP